MFKSTTNLEEGMTGERESLHMSVPQGLHISLRSLHTQAKGM